MKGKLTYMLTCGLCLGLLAGVSCVKQGLDLRDNVHIKLQWESGVVPEGSKFYFYKNDKLVRSCECFGDEYVGTLPNGDYKILVCNADARNVELVNMEDYSTAEVRAVADDSAAGKAAGCIAQPSNLLLATEFVEGEFLNVWRPDSLIKMNVAPRSRIKTVELVFKLDNAAAVKLLGGSLSGVSSGLQCSTASCTHNPQSVNFTVTNDPYGKYNYVANISVLDLVTPDASGSHILTLTVMIDGVEHTMSIDLSSTIEDLLEGEWGGVIPVEIPLEIDLKSVDGNLSAEVSPWDTTGSGSGELV